MANVTLPAKRRNRTSCPVRLTSGPTTGSFDAYAYDSENGETNSFGYLREVTSGLPGMHTYDANGHLSAATSGSNPGDACTGGTGIVNLIYAGNDPVNGSDPSGMYVHGYCGSASLFLTYQGDGGGSNCNHSGPPGARGRHSRTGRVTSGFAK